MKKSQLKTLTDGALIVEFAYALSRLAKNTALGAGVKLFSKQLEAICEELVIRGIITEEQSKEIQEK